MGGASGVSRRYGRRDAELEYPARIKKKPFT